MTGALALWISSSNRRRKRKTRLTNRYEFVFILSLNAIQKSITCSSLAYAIKCVELHLYIRYIIIKSSWSHHLFCVSCFLCPFRCGVYIQALTHWAKTWIFKQNWMEFLLKTIFSASLFVINSFFFVQLMIQMGKCSFWQLLSPLYRYCIVFFTLSPPPPRVRINLISIPQKFVDFSLLKAWHSLKYIDWNMAKIRLQRNIFAYSGNNFNNQQFAFWISLTRIWETIQIFSSQKRGTILNNEILGVGLFTWRRRQTIFLSLCEI